MESKTGPLKAYSDEQNVLYLIVIMFAGGVAVNITVLAGISRRHIDQIKFALALTDNTDKTFSMFDLVCEPLLDGRYHPLVRS